MVLPSLYYSEASIYHLINCIACSAFRGFSQMWRRGRCHNSPQLVLYTATVARDGQRRGRDGEPRWSRHGGPGDAGTGATAGPERLYGGPRAGGAAGPGRGATAGPTGEPWGIRGRRPRRAGIGATASPGRAGNRGQRTRQRTSPHRGAAPWRALGGREGMGGTTTMAGRELTVWPGRGAPGRRCGKQPRGAA